MGFSLFELMFGKTPGGVLHLLQKEWEDTAIRQQQLLQVIADLHARFTQMGQLAQKELHKAKAQQQARYDRKVRGRAFHPGQKVVSELGKRNNKMLCAWQGPFKVVERKGLNNCNPVAAGISDVSFSM